MKNIIFLFVLWIIIGYYFDSLLVATIIMLILTLAIIILLFMKKRNSTQKTICKNTTENEGKNETISIVTTYSTTTTKRTTYIPQISLYEVFHRPSDHFIDNMNYKLYHCKGLYLKTKRKRSIKIEAFDENDAMAQLRQAGFVEPFEIERASFPEITDAQKEALGNIYLGDVCQYDASEILGRQYSNDSVPNPELISYATECGMKFSYYIGKKALYDRIFRTLEPKDKIAFFVFCVYRFTTDDRRGNLNTHPYRDLFYTFAEENMANESFIKSMNKYSGEKLRYFGPLTINGITSYDGGSKDTIAYKTAKAFLKQHFSI